MVIVRLITLLVLNFNILVFAAEWPQFRGPNRDGLSPETGLLRSWPDGGPKQLWVVENIGNGWGSAAIVNNMVYIVGEIDGLETVTALDSDGKVQWKRPISGRWDKSFPEARTTPTIDGELLYVNTGLGNLACLDRTNGTITWQVQTVETFKGEYHRWGIAESPLIVDDKVIATPGGKDASVVALDKKTGAILWTSKGLSDQGSYCSPILIEHGGKKIIATMLEKHFVGIDASDGKMLWTDAFAEYQKGKDINPVSPVHRNGMIYTTSGYDDGGAMYVVSADGLSIERKWVDTTLDVHIGGVVVLDGTIYGASWEGNRDGSWVALDWDTGTVLWEHKWMNKGAIIAADGLLYIYVEKEGKVGLLQPN
ncbi:PQQ-binding-like beta-propeller repeat protein, partial [candidate division KSB1 bacterium]|nr:PQQ-binding-like beta-propeller repeat protein [candidate division KSB1 bacterium]